MGETRTVLIIDPDQETAGAAHAALEPYGLQIQVVGDGNDGLSYAKDNPPALILLALEPSNAGYAVCNKLKKAPHLKEIPVLLTSTTADPAAFEQHRKLKTRADEYLLIPDRGAYPTDELLGKAHALIGLVADGAAAAGGSDPGEVELELGDALAMEETPSSDATTVASLDFNDEATRVVSPAEFQDAEPVIEEPGLEAAFDNVAAPAEGEVDPVADLGADLAADLEQVARDTAEPMDAGTAAGPDARSARELRRVKEERDQLARELEDLRSKPSGGGGGHSREREFLNLREVISKKEKEILDLKDEIDKRERQILEQKNQMRELERKTRETDDRVIGLEKELVNAQEKIEALTHDKEKGIERETQLKARLAEAQAEIRKLEGELDATQKKAKADLAAAQEQTAQIIAERDAALAAAQEQLQNELAQAAQARVAMEESLRQEMEALKAQHAEELTSLHDRHTGTVTRLRQEHEAAMGAQRQQHDEAMSALAAERDQLLAAAEEQRQGELAAAEQRQQLALKQAAEERESALAERDARFQQEREQMLLAAEQQRRDELAGQRERFEEQLGAVQQDLQEAQGEAQRLRNAVEEIERENAGYQDQILRAYQKIKGDQALGERLRRALGVALSLVDEQARSGAGSDEEARS